MRSDSRRQIRAWFQEHDGDGEFVSGMRACPYSVIGPARGTGCIIFTTKPDVVSAAIDPRDTLGNVAMVGRYGLPDDRDLNWMGTLVGSRTVTFLGDLDPVDLMVFAWLRAALPRKRVVYGGISDGLFKGLKARLPVALSIPASPSEQESLHLLNQVLPDIRKTVGVQCANLLRVGKKIEVEALTGHDRIMQALLRCPAK